MSENGCMIGFPNRIDEGTLSGGSYNASYPLTYIKNRLIGRVARTTNAATSSTYFIVDLGQTRITKLVSLINHNMSLVGTWRVRGGSDITFATYTYDSGSLDAWPVGTTAEELTRNTPTAVHIIDETLSCQYWRVDITDTTNAAGYIQIGRVFLGPAWQPENDAAVGLMLGWQTNTTQQKALSGTKYFQRRKPYRVTTFTLNVMSVDEALQEAFEIDKMAGIDKEVFWIQSVTDTTHAARKRFLGTLRQMTPIEYPYSNLLKKAYTIEEVV